MLYVSLYIQSTPFKGRGVFTSQAIGADVVIEEAPVIVMTAEERKLLDKTLLHDYIFEWLPEGKEGCCMALGWVPIYNHAVPSNCEYFMDYDQEMISIKTMRPIEAGEELTINYNGDFDKEKTVWFEVK